MIENIFSSRNKVRILRFLIEHPFSSFSTKEIIGEIMGGSGGVQRALNDLLVEKVILSRKEGREKDHQINRKYWAYEELLSIFEKERKEYPITYFHRTVLADLKSKLSFVKKLTIFGSVAAATASRFSDIDILIVTEEKEKVEMVVERLEKKYGVKFEAVILSEREHSLYEKRKSRLLKEIAKAKIELI